MRHRHYFVPPIMLFNVMSLLPKVDEPAQVMKNNRPNIAFITETWLKNNIPDDVIQVFRQDRIEKEHGGVCIYVKKTPTIIQLIFSLIYQMSMNVKSYGLLSIYAAYLEDSPDL